MFEDEKEKYMQKAKISFTFTPNAPINKRSLFSGRSSQIETVVDVILQRGQHAVIYGERGVGKTSLANILAEYLQFLTKFDYQVVRVNCAADSTFSSIWQAAFRELTAKQRISQAGFAGTDQLERFPLTDLLPKAVSSEDVRFALQEHKSPTVVVIDEFDQLRDSAIPKLFADTVKSLSDHSVDATLLIIGVADSIDHLIAEHRSIERAIAQIQMPRMIYGELQGIIDKGMEAVEMEMNDTARHKIVTLCQGLPAHVHTLCRYAALHAVDDQRDTVLAEDISDAIKSAVQNERQTILSLYHSAISSPHQNLYKEVLLAAALAKTDELGYFAAGDLRAPLARIMKRPFGIDRYLKHLKEFCGPRGPVLEKSKHPRPRFRFKDSMMEPFVIMKGIKDKLITETTVIEIENQKKS